jgi:protoporphyrinogen oxidase
MTVGGSQYYCLIFFHKIISGAELKFNHLIEDIQEDGDRYVVKTQHGVTETFDCVILTMPVPQILKLQGIVQKTIG